MTPQEKAAAEKWFEQRCVKQNYGLCMCDFSYDDVIAAFLAGVAWQRKQKVVRK